MNHQDRTNMQLRVIRHYAKVLQTDCEAAARLWCDLGLAKRWADYESREF